MPFAKVITIARLTRDVEMRVTPTGKAICQFGIAVNTKFGDREDVMFIDVEAWEKKAETLARYFKKGDPIYIEGRLKLDTWDDKTTGQKRSKHKVVLDNFEFIQGKKEEGAGGDQQQDSGGYPPPAQERHTPPPARPAPPASQGGMGDLDSSDVPF